MVVEGRWVVGGGSCPARRALVDGNESGKAGLAAGRTSRQAILDAIRSQQEGDDSG